MKNNIVWHQHDVDKQRRAQAKGQKPCVVWLTGLSGSGKSTIANLLEKKLADNGKHTYLLDGDNVRHGLNGDLTFSDKDRVENIRRISELAKLFVDSGLIVITAFISPFKGERDYCRNLLQENEFVEVFVDTPIEECEKRDPKGLYQKARAGEITDFTGISSPYEAPESPEVILNFNGQSAQESAEQLFTQLKQKGLID
ncbi:adenylyl-sulfate kinase [Paraglaciecola agarilytica]|uniref:adenylyl-sulfate kinase n=1 Tax=Paraglaciecola chathamensis TaxID=368405 RepID=UPI001C08224F|nr:adenylyl-sulfate kinase [Paraglaciecola agarilytica]MBU3016434.1 adenylyl-sulfate kinase [Paraglaciecola agarilytica]